MRTDSTSSITGAIITAVATAALISNVSGVWTCPSEREPFCCGKYSNVDEDPMAVIGIECMHFFHPCPTFSVSSRMESYMDPPPLYCYRVWCHDAVCWLYGNHGGMLLSSPFPFCSRSEARIKSWLTEYLPGNNSIYIGVNAPRNDNCTDGVPVQCCKPMVGVVSSPLLSIISTIETCFRSYPDMCINFILFLTFPPLFLHIGRPCHISNSNMRHYFFPPRTRSRNHRRIPSHTRIRGRVITAIARLLDMVRVSGSNSELEG